MRCSAVAAPACGRSSTRQRRPGGLFQGPPDEPRAAPDVRRERRCGRLPPGQRASSRRLRLRRLMLTRRRRLRRRSCRQFYLTHGRHRGVHGASRPRKEVRQWQTTTHHGQFCHESGQFVHWLTCTPGLLYGLVLESARGVDPRALVFLRLVAGAPWPTFPPAGVQLNGSLHGWVIELELRTAWDSSVAEVQHHCLTMDGEVTSQCVNAHPTLIGGHEVGDLCGLELSSWDAGFARLRSAHRSVELERKDRCQPGPWT